MFNLPRLGKRIEEILGGFGNQAQRALGNAGNQVQQGVRQVQQTANNVARQNVGVINRQVQNVQRQIPKPPQVDFNKLSRNLASAANPLNQVKYQADFVNRNVVKPTVNSLAAVGNTQLAKTVNDPRNRGILTASAVNPLVATATGISLAQRQFAPQTIKATDWVGKNVAEPFNQTLLGGRNRQIINLAGNATKLAGGIPGYAIDKATGGQFYGNIDKATQFARDNFAPEPGKKNSLSPTKVEDYNGIQKKSRFAGTVAGQVVDMIPVGKAGTAANAATKGLPVVNKLSQGNKLAQLTAKGLPYVSEAVASEGLYGAAQKDYGADDAGQGIALDLAFNAITRGGGRVLKGKGDEIAKAASDATNTIIKNVDTPQVGKTMDELQYGFSKAKDNAFKIIDDPKYRGTDGKLTPQGQKLARAELAKGDPYLKEMETLTTPTPTQVGKTGKPAVKSKELTAYTIGVDEAGKPKMVLKTDKPQVAIKGQEPTIKAGDEAQAKAAAFEAYQKTGSRAEYNRVYNQVKNGTSPDGLKLDTSGGKFDTLDTSKTQSGFLTQVQKRFTDQDAVILNTLRRIEKENGQKGLVDKFMYDSNMVRGSNAKANVFLENSQDLNDALGGLSKADYDEFSKYANARAELSTADKAVATSKDVGELSSIVQGGEAVFGKRFEALNKFYKNLAEIAHQAGVISDETLDDYVKNGDYIRIQRDMGDLIPPNTGSTRNRSLTSTVMKQKRKGSSREILPAGETAATFAQQVHREAAKSTAARNLIGMLAQDGQARRLVDSEDVAFRKEMYKFMSENKQIPLKKVNEYVDALVRDALDSTAKNLDIDVKRVMNNRGKWIGRSFQGQKNIELKAGAPERVMIHEIGHQLDEKFGIQDAVLGTGRSLPVKTLDAQIRRATEAGDKELAAALTKQNKLNKEVRKLAALRYEGSDPGKSFANYVNKSEEKVAVMFESYLHAPQRFKGVAPTLYKEFKNFLSSNAETAGLAKIKPSLVLDKRVVQNRAVNPELDEALKKAYQAARARADMSTKNKNTVSFFKNGIKETWEVSADMKEAINNVNPYTMDVVMKMLAAPGRMFRAGVTGMNPVFIARNLVKDQVGSAIISESDRYTHNPVNMWLGLWGSAKNSVGANNDPLFREFLQHYGNQTSYDLTRNVDDAVNVVERIRGGKKATLKQGFKSPIRSIENLASVTEISTRFQNYRGIYNKAIADGLPKDIASEKAAMAAWQNSVDFSRAGTWGRAINTVIPYWNPATQGVRQMVRSTAKHPIKTPLKASLIIGAPLLTAIMWNNSSEDTKKVWNNIPEYEKENNIILIPPGTKQNEDGTYDVIKIPMAPGWKEPFVAMARAFDNYANERPQNGMALALDMLNTLTGPVNIRTPEQLIGSVTPQAIKPIVQQAINKDMFSGQQIVPDYIENATDAEGNPIPENKKAYENGSGSAQIVGDMFGVSPIRVDKFIKDTAGTVGLNMQNLLDRTLAATGTIDKNAIGGQSVAEGMKKSFRSVRGVENENATAGQKYYDNIGQVTSNFTGNEKAAFNSLHPNKKNFLGDVIYENDSTYNSAARLDIYNRYPKVFDADKQLDAIGRAEGKPGNPLFDLTPAQVKKVLEKENLPPGAKDPELSNLYAQDWYAEYRNNKTKYFESIKESQKKDLQVAIDKGDTESAVAIQKSMDKFANPNNPYPETPPELQKVMDYYNNLPKGTGARSQWIRSNPGLFDAMKQQWASVDNWQNVARGKRGLAATEGEAGVANGFGTSDSTKYASSGGGSGGSSRTKGFNPYQYEISAKAGGKIYKPTVKMLANGAKISAVKSAAPKVSIKKSKV